MKIVYRKKRAGFTIIELLVAVAVTAMMVGLMFSIVVNVLQGWERSSGSLSSGNQARTVLDQLARDLQSSIIRRDGNVWLAATIQDAQTGTGDAGVVGARWDPASPGKPKPSGVESIKIPLRDTNTALDDFRFGQGGVWLRFISTCSDINDGQLHRISAPRAVAYQIVRLPVVAVADPSQAEYRYQLFRSEVRPGHTNATLAAQSTFGIGYNVLDARYNNASDTNSGVLIQNGVDQGGQPGSIRRPGRDQIIANNVIDFGVRFWGREDDNADGVIDGNDKLVVIFPKGPSNLGFAATSKAANDLNFPAQSNSIGAPSTGFPEFAEVFVRILTDAGVAKIESLEKGLSAGDWWEIAEANSQVYIRRIDFKTSL